MTSGNTTTLFPLDVVESGTLPPSHPRHCARFHRWKTWDVLKFPLGCPQWVDGSLVGVPEKDRETCRVCLENKR